jgi:hypothetical protein
MRGVIMPRFYLHLRDHVDEIIDDEGIELSGLEAVKKAVMAAARDVMSGDVRAGVLDLRYRIDAEDEQGAIAYSLPFQYAVSIVPTADAAA